MKITPKIARVMLNLTQREFEKIFKISQSSLSRIEKGEDVKSKQFYLSELSKYFETWKLREIEKLQFKIDELKQCEIQK